MNGLREILRGFIAVALCSAIVLGAFALAMAEGRGFGVALTTAQTPSPQSTPLSNQHTLTPSVGIEQPTNSTPTPPAPTPCRPPMGWNTYFIQAGDTLESLALSSGSSVQQLRQANCMLVDSIKPDTLFYLPPTLNTPTAPILAYTATQLVAPTALMTLVPTYCGHPIGWVRYTVRAGDTLYALSRAYGITVWELQIANCLPSANQIYVGQSLYVPNVPTRTPTPTITRASTAITSTSTPTRTATATSTGTATNTPTATPTDTPTATPTDTPTATPTNTPTDTPTATPVGKP